jgi:glycosyltransferase involved in cell wall biosynthesis
LALHQEPSDVKNDFQVDRSKGREKTRPILEQKCPTPYIRKYQQGITYEVPKVSIYIPAYNVEEYLKDAVDSALAQTYTDLEVVICNDGSTDGTIGVLEENYTNNHRVRWITQSNQGIASATNAAIKACKGMYIGQLDADDMLHPQAVETFVSHLDSNNDGVAYGFYTKMDHQGKMIQVNHSVPFLREKLLVGMICSHFRMFRKREWLRTAGCDLSLKNAVDYDLMLKFSEICSIRYIPQLSYYYRIHGANTSFSERLLQERNHVLVINKALSRMRLSSKWLAVSGPPDNRRHVRFINQDQ